MRADSAVEPTKSENITVTWRRSARSSGEVLGAVEGATASFAVALAPRSARRAAMASSRMRRCPRAAIPSSFRSSAVRLGRDLSSILLSRNAASYSSIPRLRSQSPRSMTAPPRSTSSPHHRPGKTRCPGGAPSVLRMCCSTVLAEDLTSEWVHVVKLLTHDAGHGLIGIGVLRDLVGYKTLNTEHRVRAAVDKGSHFAN